MLRLLNICLCAGHANTDNKIILSRKCQITIDMKIDNIGKYFSLFFEILHVF